MHSRVFEISSKPIDAESRLDEYLLPDWFCRGIADYVDSTKEEDRPEELSWFSSRFAGNCKVDGDMVSFEAKTKHDYFRFNYNKFREAAAVLAVCDFEAFCESKPCSDFETTMHKLKSSYEDRFGFYVYDRDNEELITMDSWVRQADLSVPYYIGSIIDYHW